MKNLKTAEIHEFVEMTESELKNTFGGSGGDSGPSGYEPPPYPYCTWKCFCLEDRDADNPPYSEYGHGPCSQAPWDRNGDCETGYQDCYLV